MQFAGTRSRYIRDSMTATDSAVKALDGLGFDASLLDVNLRLSPEERALRHQAALRLATTLAASGERLRGRPQPAATAPLRR